MIDLSTIPSYTDAELLNLYRYALVQLAVSEEITIAGRTVRRSALPQIRETIQWLEQRVSAAGNESGGNIALAQLGQPFPTGQQTDTSET